MPAHSPPGMMAAMVGSVRLSCRMEAFGADPEALGKARIGEEIADRIQNAIGIQGLHKPFLNQCFRRGNHTLSDEVGNFL